MSPDLVLQLLVYGLTGGAVVALSAVGFTLAYAVARQISLAHGSVFALTTVVVATLASALGVTADSPLPNRVLALLLLYKVTAAGEPALSVPPFTAIAPSTFTLTAPPLVLNVTDPALMVSEARLYVPAVNVTAEPLTLIAA